METLKGKQFSLSTGWMKESMKKMDIFQLCFMFFVWISEAGMLDWDPGYEKSHLNNPFLSTRVQIKIDKGAWL